MGTEAENRFCFLLLKSADNKEICKHAKHACKSPPNGEAEKERKKPTNEVPFVFFSFQRKAGRRKKERKIPAVTGIFDFVQLTASRFISTPERSFPESEKSFSRI